MPVSLGLLQDPRDERLRMPAVAVGRLAEDRADSADAHRPLIEHRRKIVLCGAGKDIVALHERKSSLVTAAGGRMN